MDLSCTRREAFFCLASSRLFLILASFSRMRSFLFCSLEDRETKFSMKATGSSGSGSADWPGFAEARVEGEGFCGDSGTR